MDQYKVLSFIAKGSFGKVYKIMSNKDNKTYALKKIELMLIDKYSKESILTELKLLLFHDHPYLLGAIDIFIEENALHIVTPFAKRIDLRNYIKVYKKHNAQISEKKIWKILCEIIISTSYLHDYSIIHRDIKTQNILFENNYDIFLADFGVSKILPPTKIHTNTQIGTPFYLSPEVINGNRYTTSTDVWAIGCVLYELMYGQMPYEAQNLYQLYYKIKNNNVVYPVSNYSCELVDLLKELLNKNEYRRPNLNNILSRNFIKQKIDYLGLYLPKKNVYREMFLHKTFNIPDTTNEWNIVIKRMMTDKKEMENKIKDTTLNLNHNKYKINNHTKLPPLTPTISSTASKIPVFVPPPLYPPPPKYRPKIIEYKKKLPELSIPSSRYLMPCLSKNSVNKRKYPTPPLNKNNQPLKFFY